MSRPPAPDQAARDRIARDLDVNLLVEAGAGSGKTEELTRRMAAGIAAGAYALEGMAAVTFTRKAAAELRGRFQLALERELAAGGPADRRKRIRDALSNLERFFAGTIHAFAARLLRERPVEAGVSPGFTELDDVEERLVRERSWRDYRTQAHAAGDRDLLELVEAGITAKKLDSAFETVCLYEDVEFPTGSAPMPDVAATWSALERFWNALSALLPSPLPDGSTCKTMERAEGFGRAWRAYGRGRREPARLTSLLQPWESSPKVVQKWWASKVVAKQAEQLWIDFRAGTVVPYLTAWRRYVYARCITLLVKAREAARAERRRRNTLSFNDLLLLSADVLRTNAPVRRALQQKYRWLFVDEFQDTDPVQAEIMFLLAADEGDEADASGGPLNWRSVRLRPGALFVVGDPKQSIYRFRRADIDIYNEVRRRIGGDNEANLVRLTTNFRSVPGLCDWANDVFRGRFPTAPTPQAPAFSPLAPYRVAADGPHLATIDVPGTLDGGAIAADEADCIARYIAGEVAAGRRRYGDFLVLTRQKRRLRPYAAALEAAGVPIEVTGAGAFGDSDEVRQLALLLLALADPQDAVALAGVLRGALFGLSDRDLFAFREAGGYVSLFADIDAVAGGAARVAAALARLRQWFTWTRTLPPGAALDRVLDDAGYLALAAAGRGGVEAGDLLHAVDRVRAVVADGFTLAAAADALAGWSALEGEEENDSTEVDSLPLEPGRPDVVRLMNLHKAKGLEASVVFLADPLGGYPVRVDIRIVREGASALGYFRILEDRNDKFVQRPLAEPADWDRLEIEERGYLDAELDRLFYVAATRAKDLLVVGRYQGNAGNRKLAWEVLAAKVGNAPALDIPPLPPQPSAPPVDLSRDAASGAARAAEHRHGRAQRASVRATSVTAEVKRLPRAVVEDVDPSDATRVVVPGTPSHRADAGVAWGSLVHGLLEHAMRHRGASEDDLSRLARWLTMEEPALRPLIDQAVAAAIAVVRSPELAAARAAPDSHVEVPFAVGRTIDDVPTIVTGAIDLVHRDGEGWRVVDYKTDVDQGTAAAKYAAQIGAYGEAWRQVSGSRVTTAIVSARPGR